MGHVSIGVEVQRNNDGDTPSRLLQLRATRFRATKNRKVAATRSCKVAAT